MKQAKAPTVSALIDRTSRSLSALHSRLQVERDPERLSQLRQDIAARTARLENLKAERTNATR
jgi:hypothetical protein